LSEALQLIVIVPETVVPLTGDEIEAVGGVVSTVVVGVVGVLGAVARMVMVAPEGEAT
jgi:hypothetical protein